MKNPPLCEREGSSPTPILRGATHRIVSEDRQVLQVALRLGVIQCPLKASGHGVHHLLAKDPFAHGLNCGIRLVLEKALLDDGTIYSDRDAPKRLPTLLDFGFAAW